MSIVRRILASSTIALLGLTSAALTAVAPAQAATTAADVTLTGVGHGHGVGMSQYGAKVRAEQGAGPQQILAHYYPGTTLTAAPTRPVRVLLTRDDGQNTCVATPENGEPCLAVAYESGQQFRNLASGATVAVPAALNGQPVTAVAAGAGPSGLRLWVKAGSWQMLEGGAQFTGPIDITAPDRTQRAIFGNGRTRDYRGTLRVVRSSDTRISRVNELPMSDYLLGVVPAEMIPSWSTAAVQAQGVAAATFAAAAMARAGSNTHDLCDTTSCQVYGGLTSESPAATSKLQASPLAGQILTVRGAPINAMFSSSNGGWSTDGGSSYLPAKQDTADSDRTWSRTIPGACMAQKYPGNGDFVGVTVLRRDGRGAHGGRVTSLDLRFTQRSVRIAPSGSPMAVDSAIRQAFTGCGETGLLRSSMFTVAGAPVPPGPGRLVAGQSVENGQALASRSAQHAVLTGNGWRIISRTCPPGPARGTGPGRLVMQSDGNLVYYGRTVWSSGTAGNPGAYATIQDDGNVVVYSAAGVPLWQAGATCSAMESWDRPSAYSGPQPPALRPGDVMFSTDRRARFVMQGDGNLVLYRDGRPLWSTRTHGNPGAFAVLQSDGNFVVYAAGNRPLWHTSTLYPANAANLVDSNLVVVQTDRVELWGRTFNGNLATPVVNQVRWRS